MDMTKRNLKLWCLILTLSLAMAALLSGCKGADDALGTLQRYVPLDKYVRMVRTGHLEMAPDIEVGKAFDDFFADGKWKSFESDKGQRVVEFSGDCLWGGKKATATIQFLVNEKDSTFHLGYVKIGNDQLSVLESAAVMEKIFSSYKNGSTSRDTDIEVDDNKAGADSTAAPPSPTPAASNLQDFVQEKNDLDVQIANLSNQINAYLSNHASLRGANSLRQQAEALVGRTKSARQRLNSTDAEDSGKKQALGHLFDLESERAYGLYKGLLDSQNGGDYSNGFRQGTKASYQFDDANNTFNANY